MHALHARFALQTPNDERDDDERDDDERDDDERDDEERDEQDERGEARDERVRVRAP